MSGRISFIGAGPGAADLITVRGARRIAEADIVVWAASLVTPECIREHASSDAELVDSSRLTHEQALEIFRRAERDRLKVARVHSGDPSLWGAVQEQHDACARMDVEVEIVPGVPAFAAAAAAVGRELTVPEVAQSVILTRLEGGKTPMPDRERVREFAKHGTTMALFLSAARTGQLVDELRAGGYDDDTPVLVAYKVTWPDELILRTTLADLEKTVKQHKLWRHTLFLVGPFLNAGGTRSHLYHAGHFHTYRRADPAARRALRAERNVDPPEREERRARPDADLAWWAVRDWQESARGSSRVPAVRPSAPARKVKDDQPDLFVDLEDAPQAADQPVEPPEETAVDVAPVEPTVVAEPAVAVEEPPVVVEKAVKQSEEPEEPSAAAPEAETATAKTPEAEPKPRTKAPRTSAARQAGGAQATARTTPKTRKTPSKASGARSAAKRKRSGESEQ